MQWLKRYVGHTSFQYPVTPTQTGSRGDRRAQAERQVGANAAAARRLGECVPVKFSSTEKVLVMPIGDSFGFA